jgi:membrane protease YdiL (CAAX protease family)
MLLVVLQNALFVVLTLGVFWGGALALRAFGRRVSFSPAPLGFVKPPRGSVRAVLIGFAVGLVAVFASAGLVAASRYVLEALGYPVQGSPQQPLMEGISSWVSESPAIAIPLVFLIVGVLTPIAEEILFRGGIFGGLNRLFSAIHKRIFDTDSGSLTAETPSRSGVTVSFILAAGISSAMFASLHLEPALFLSIFALAMVLCWLRSRGGLLAPIATHATFNSFTVAVLVLSGLGVLPQSI